MRRNTLFWGSLFIIAGVLFMLQNLGYLNVNVWNLLWSIFLIALGISFLWGAVLRKPVRVEHANVPLEGARTARVRVRHGAGRLQIAAGAGPGDLAVGDFGGGLELNTRRDGDLLDATLSLPSRNFPFDWGPGESLDWSFQLARDLPMTLDLETGANESRLDLSDLLVTGLSLKSGASSTDLNLPAHAGLTQVRVETGAAAVRILVPDGVSARIRARGGLSSINIDSRRFPPLGDLYESPDFMTAANKVDLDIETGVGSIDIR
ncbi:MAG TPA: DUF5668 domain-containing protein [Anaerolineales bacterium]